MKEIIKLPNETNLNMESSRETEMRKTNEHITLRNRSRSEEDE